MKPEVIIEVVEIISSTREWISNRFSPTDTSARARCVWLDLAIEKLKTGVKEPTPAEIECKRRRDETG